VSICRKEKEKVVSEGKLPQENRPTRPFFS
jgi:hypothetical protein